MGAYVPTTAVRHAGGLITVSLIEYPGAADWIQVYRRALITQGKHPKHPDEEPSSQWKKRILTARHSPIRRLLYSFEFDAIPSNIATHFCRHVHAQPFVSSLRNDRQTEINGDTAPRNSPVRMILDVNGEELQEMANKRLCNKAATITRWCMEAMANLAAEVTPEIETCLVPRCIYCGGVCHEMQSCGRCAQA